MDNKQHAVYLFAEEKPLLAAIKSLRQKGIHIHEVYSPYPVHGIDEALGYKRSRLPIVAFLCGLMGLSIALIMQIGMMTIDWPMIIGGKDFLPLPVFIPVSFELTVLLAAFGMVITFLLVSDLKPWAKPKLFSKRSTNDRHVLVINMLEQDNKLKQNIEDIMKDFDCEDNTQPNPPQT